MKRLHVFSALVVALMMAMGAGACGPKAPGADGEVPQGRYCPKNKAECDGEGPPPHVCKKKIVCPHEGPCPGGEDCPDRECPGGKACPHKKAKCMGGEDGTCAYKKKCRGDGEGVCARKKKKCMGDRAGMCPKKPHICDDGEPCTNQCRGKCSKPECPRREDAPEPTESDDSEETNESAPADG